MEKTLDKMVTKKETGTLAELNVRPGDVFELINFMFEPCTLQSDGRILIGDGPEYYGYYPENGDLMGHIVSRAHRHDGQSPDAPKTWGEMTDEERRDISFSAMSGKVIELDAYGKWVEWDGKTPLCETHLAIRVRPEPKRETVTMYGYVISSDKCVFSEVKGIPGDTHRITLPFLDGNIPAGTYTSETNETIIVEEL
jgi:hypothetical protein